MKTWVILLVTYLAPMAHPAEWHGPWEKGVITAGKDFFRTETECRNAAVMWIRLIHAEGVGAPTRFQCVPFPDGLPVGAPK